MYSITDDSLEDYIDLDTLLRFPFQKLVESVTGFVGPPHLQLWRKPPIMDVYSLFGEENGTGEVPVIVATINKPLRSYVHSDRGETIKPVGTRIVRALRCSLQCSDKLQHLALHVICSVRGTCKSKDIHAPRSSHTASASSAS
jgi:hypothetical protein